MSRPIHVAVRQRSPEWLAERRGLITATDVPVLLGISPWRSEGDLAREKMGTGPGVDETLRMRIGSALEPVIAAEYEAATGRRLRRFHGLLRHPVATWAGASPDYRVVGERRLVEVKWTGSRARFADGLPQDVEAQVQWQLFVAGLPSADVAALVGDDLRIFAVEADEAAARDIVAVAADFRRRMASGGPFSESLDSVKRLHPSDDGSEMAADADLDAAVRALVALRGRRKGLEADEAVIETAIKTRMAEAAVLTGDGWHVVWRRTKDRTTTDWKTLAAEALAPLAETERAALVRAHSTVQEGFRPFRVVMGDDKED